MNQFTDVHIVGDLHLYTHSLRRAGDNIAPTDLVICLGDVGINFTPKYREQNRKTFAEFPYQFLFVYGNHEQRPEELPNYRKYESPIGAVYRDPKYPNQWFAIDGTIYNINDKSYLIIGGATSIDAAARTPYKSYWPTEQIRAKDIQRALSYPELKVDIILTHTCPECAIPMATKFDNPDEKLLQVIYDSYDFGMWFCGHFHINKWDKDHFIEFLDANLKDGDELTFVSPILDAFAYTRY